jgi:2',3'-cyclic-nucleotide 2'-phosphodiesterase/3'-nucleotidase/5'-nucleotidase
MISRMTLAAAACAAATTAFAAATPRSVSLEVRGTFQRDDAGFDQGAAEIVAYDAGTRRAFVINAQQASVDVLDVQNLNKPRLVATIDVDPNDLGLVANSVDVANGLVAVALQADPKTDPGFVAFYSTTDYSAPLNVVGVGVLPDMVTFTPDGRYVLTADEGEPNDDYTIDPEGSVSVIDLGAGVANATVRTADFRAFNGDEDALRAAGIRIYGPNASAAQDFEPEYIAISGGTAYVTLQENNALALIDIASATVEAVLPLGYKDHSLPGNELDASDRDGAIAIVNWPVFGMYQPDSIAAYEVDGKTYLVTANEGDTRDYDTFSEEDRVRDLDLDPGAFPDASALQANSALGRLTVTNTLGDTDGDGDFDALYVPGARSFTIWDAATGAIVFDSGADFERITANLLPAYFNANNDNNDFDNRSDNKGPEPEGLAVGQIGDRWYAFIGLERIGGVMVYDVTDPSAPTFATYLNHRNFESDVCVFDPADDEECIAIEPAALDLGPEGFEFVPAKDSPNAKPLLIVGNEVSGSTTIYQVDVLPRRPFTTPPGLD